MTNPLISVIIPVYNVEKYIRQCLNSIIAQTYTNLEIILVDDGSTDNSGKICDEYAKKDNRIKVIHKQNEGLPSARNVALKVCSGQYVGFVDSDDHISSDMYEYLYNLITENNADISMCNMFIEKNEQRIKSNIIDTLYKCVTQEEFFKFPCWRVVWNKLYRSSLLRNFSFTSGISYGEDTLFLFEVITHSDKMAIGNKQKYYYRENSSSITHKFNKRNMQYLDIEKRIMDYAKVNNLPQLYKQALDARMNAAGTWLKQIAEQDIEYRESVRQLTNFIRSNLKYFFACSMKLSKRCFVLIGCINFTLAKMIYRIIFRIKTN